MNLSWSRLAAFAEAMVGERKLAFLKDVNGAGELVCQEITAGVFNALHISSFVYSSILQ
jgi:hypothetical protein